MKLVIAGLVVFILTAPFGYWRATVPFKSKKWFLAVHLPILFIIIVRFAFGFAFTLYSFIILDLAFFFGQLFGGYYYKYVVKKRKKDINL